MSSPVTTGTRITKLRTLVNTQSDPSPRPAANAVADLASNTTSSDAGHRHEVIAEAAYLRAELRRFEPGHDVEDWLAAESALNLQQAPVDPARSS
jgi:hypothetical protein